MRGAGRQGDDARGRGRRGGGERGAGARARGDRRAARCLERASGRRRRPRAAAGADRLRPRARGRALLRSRRPQQPAGPPLACGAAARAPARAPARGGRARAAGRDDRLLGLHDQRGRGGGGRGHIGLRGGCDARGRVAAVPSPGAARVPADAPARARDRRLLRRRGCARDAHARPRVVARRAGRHGVARLAPDDRRRRARSAGRFGSGPRSRGRTSRTFEPPIFRMERQPCSRSTFPRSESEHEADALRLWDGRGAVALLDCRRRARGHSCSNVATQGRRSGTIEDDEEATRIAGRGAAPDLAVRRPTEHRFRILREEAASWAVQAPGATGRRWAGRSSVG